MPTLCAKNPDGRAQVLNRIYIIVGLIAILVLAGAFIAPRFIQWGDYRTRMEELATGVLGTPVTIRGGIEFSLLPQPRLKLADVLVGSPEEPAATVDSVEAQFSLLDFLRDNYNVTKLVLIAPVIDFTVDESGFFGSGVSVSANSGGVSLNQALVQDATVRLMDRRSGETFVADDLDGELKIASLSGPFQFQGTARYRDNRYGIRFNSAAMDSIGVSRASGLISGEGFTLAADGVLTPGMAPKFDGTMTYRQTPPKGETADDIRGDLVLQSKVAASSDRIVLSGYTLQPDENRAGTRLTGAASIQLGARRSFDAVISGGVFSLPPRDAKEDATTQPYELVRLLGELPPPIVPPIEGRVGIDLAEVGLRGFALRNLRIAATTDGQSWKIEQLVGDLPGNTELHASGLLSNQAGAAGFDGSFSLDSQRLDGLAALWRKPDAANILFNQPGRLDGAVLLGGDAIGISKGVLTLAGANHALELRLGFGAEKRLDVVGHFDALGDTGSAMIEALLPRFGNEPAFGLSFPDGSFSLTGKSARLFGQDGTDLVAEGQWGPGVIRLARLSAGDWGGLTFDTTLTASGTLDKPVVSGSGRFAVQTARASGLAAIYDLVQMPEGWRNALAQSVPADLLIDLGAADESGAQLLTLGGAVGAGDVNVRADLGAGIGALSTGQLRLTASIDSDDVAALTRQLGLGASDLFDGDTMLVSVGLEGVPGDGLSGSINASSADESLGFAGDLQQMPNSEIQGTGTLTVNLNDAGALAQVVGARGLSLPMASASAELHFEGERLARLASIVGTSAETGFSGELSLSRTGSTAAVAGAIAIDSISVEGLAATMFGPAALVPGASVWSDGPISVGDTERQTRGTVTVSAGSVTGGGQPRLGAASFELSWDETKLRLGRFQAALEDGSVTLDLTVCCAGPLVDKTVEGRLGIAKAAIDNLAAPQIAGALGGTLDAGMQFSGTGASLADVVAVLAGEGSFTVSSFTVDQLSPAAFATIAGLDDVLNTDADALNTLIGLAVQQGSFVAPSAAGAFTIAGGVARMTNFIVEGNGGRLAGDISVALPDLGLAGSFVLTPLGFDDAKGLVSNDTARIVTRIAGSVMMPQVTLDLAEMVAAIQVRANEMEVDRLEILQAQDAERQRAAAAERNRLIEEQRQKAAAEAARLAAEEAARLAVQAEAQRLEEERVARELQLQQVQPPAAQAPFQTTPVQPFNFTLQPQVNQPTNPVNRPF